MRQHKQDVAECPILGRSRGSIARRYGSPPKGGVPIDENQAIGLAPASRSRSRWRSLIPENRDGRDRDRFREQAWLCGCRLPPQQVCDGRGRTAAQLLPARVCVPRGTKGSVWRSRRPGLHETKIPGPPPRQRPLPRIRATWPSTPSDDLWEAPAVLQQGGPTASRDAPGSRPDTGS